MRLGLNSAYAAQPFAVGGERPAAFVSGPAVALEEPVAYAPSATVPRVAVEDLCVRYGPVTALAHVSLAVGEGEIVCLLGPSGSGKSTLLRTIAGIDRPTSGRILIDGDEMSGARQFVEPEHRSVGMVFQDYALFPHLTIAANVAFGLATRRRAEADAIVRELLDRLDLRRHAGSYPHMLSGGERQRVALARALAPAPRVLLMDEPFSGLDDRLRDRVRAETVALLRETRTTTIVVTHDPGEAMRIADRIALLHRGRLVQCGPPDQLYSRPATLFAARFFSDLNEVCATCRDGCVETPFGTFPAPHLRERTTAAVCIRPQHVQVSRQPAGVLGRVVRTAFLGEIDQIEAAVDGLDAPVVARAFGRTSLRPGDDVFLDVDPRDVLVLAEEAILQPDGVST